MKAFKTLLLLLALGLSVYGQAVNVTANKLKGSATAPSGACSAQQVQLTTAGVVYVCASGTWTSSGGGTTINSTNGQVPYRVNSTTFGDSGIAYSSGMIGIQTTPSAAQLEINSQSTTRPGLKLRALSGTAASQEVFQSYDASGVLRNTFNADGTFRVYNTYTDASNYERFGITASATKVTLDTSSAGTGSARLLEIGTRGAAALSFFTNNTDRWIISSSGHFLAGTDNTYDIGASGATRPRNMYAAGNVVLGGQVQLAATQFIQWGTRLYVQSQSDGVLEFGSNGGGSTTPRIQFGGTSASFPALKRSSATLHVRLADDSDYAPLTAALVGLKSYTVAALPAASSYEGSTAYVSDANATTRLSTVAGGGSNKVIVYSDGTNWIIL